MSAARCPVSRLSGCERGASALEFALLAPVFFGFIFGLVEMGRLLWVSQTLNEVSYSAARCMSTSSVCGTTAKVKTYAVGRAGKYRLTVAPANVVTASNVTCDGNANSNKVTITYPIHSAVRPILPMIPNALKSHACFPKLS